MSQAVQGELKAGYRPRSAQAQRRSLMLASARPWISAHQGFTTLLLLFLATIPLVNPWVRGDGVGYYAYVRSLLVEHSLDFSNDWRNGNQSFTMGRVRPDGSIDPSQYTPAGHLDNHFAVGPSMLWAPFLVPVHLAVLTLQKLGANVQANGFSRPYIVTMALATALYGFVGLYFSFRIGRLYVEERWALLATVGIWLASSLPVYMYFNPSWSHAHSVFVVAGFLWYWQRTRQGRTFRQWLILGLICGLMLDVYYANIALLMIPLLESLKGYWRGWRAQGHDMPTLRRLFAANLLFVLATLIAFLPTLITKQIVFGHPLDFGYSGEEIWTSPTFAQLLFSSDHGLLTWTPVIIPALAGLVLLCRYDLELWIYSLGAFAAFCYVIACHTNWDGLSSFGNRFFLSLAPLFVLGLAVAFREFSRWFRGNRQAWVLASAVTCLLIVWNLAFIFQWGNHLIPVRGPISWRQMASNQVRVVPAQFARQIRAYFSSRSGLMQEIEQKDLRQLKGK
ncbi:MAG TPA: hypothetical protein VG206_23330 [Terriglobia bacterium]|nr:hypothetical protein [Terriglobia bacterium]